MLILVDSINQMAFMHFVAWLSHVDRFYIQYKYFKESFNSRFEGLNAIDGNSLCFFMLKGNLAAFPIMNYFKALIYENLQAP